MGERPGEVGRYPYEVSPTNQRMVVTETNLSATSQGTQDPDAIQTDIEHTRAEMSETIDAIQARLSPQQLKEQAKDVVYDATVGRAQQTAQGVKSSMMNTIKQHPLPAAIAGLSLGYLFMKRSSSGSSSQQQRYVYSSSGSSGGGMQQRAGQMAQEARDTAQQWSSEATDQASHYADQAQQQASEATDWLGQQVHQNPLAVGAVAVAIGAAVGLTVPETHMENQLMGEARDSLMQQAKSTAQETMHKAQHVAEEAAGTAKQAAKQQGLSG